MEIVSEGQVVGENAIYNIEKNGFLKEKKVMETNLFWQEKHSGKIKYEVEPYHD
jgi:hypothetical protein